MFSEISSTIGDRVRSVRKSLHIRQKDLADRMSVHGVTLNRIENGVISPTAQFSKHFCDELGIDPFWLLFGNSTSVREVGNDAVEKTASLFVSDIFRVFMPAPAGPLPGLIGEPTGHVIPLNGDLARRTTHCLCWNRNDAPGVPTGAFVGVDVQRKDIADGRLCVIWVPEEGAVIQRYIKSMHQHLLGAVVWIQAAVSEELQP